MKNLQILVFFNIRIAKSVYLEILKVFKNLILKVLKDFKNLVLKF